MTIKVVSKRNPGAPHVEDRIYVGPDKDHLAYVGTLNFGVDSLYQVVDFNGPGIHGITGEWQLFTSALALGAQRMNGDVEVLFEGDDEIIRQLEEEAKHVH